MNQTVKSVVGCGFIFVAALVCAHAQYSLEKLEGVTSDYGASFNNLDQVVAGSKYWANGVATTLTGLGGGFTVAQAINNHGEIAGYSSDQNSTIHATIWKNGVITGLSSVAPGSSSVANGINDSGQIVGTVVTSGVSRAVTWSDTQAAPVELGLFSGYGVSFGEAINNQGIVAGVQSMNGLSPTVFFQNGQSLVQVGSPGNIYGAAVTAINNSGVVVGQLNGFAYSFDGSLHEIGPFNYGLNGVQGINAFGEMVGSQFTNGARRPFVYINGVLTDLDSLFPNALPGNLHFQTAWDINDKGDILLSDERNFLYVAHADNPHHLPGLSPVPEPASFGFFAASGLIGLVAAKRRRFFGVRSRA